MILLESGPARTDRLYWGVVSLVFVGMIAYFFYDGTVGYRKQNIAQAQNELALIATPPAELGERPTEEDFLQVRDGKIATRDEVHAILGQPLTPRPGVPSEGVEVFASIYGAAYVPIDAAGHVRRDRPGWQWTSWKHTKSAIRGQYLFGVVAIVPALYALYRAWRAATLRATIDDEGLTYGGMRLAWADIASIRDYNRKGWVDLYYHRGAQEKRLRIDNQKIAKFDEIIALLCERKGFPDPVKAYTEARPESDGEEQATAATSAHVDVKSGGETKPGAEA